MSMLANIIKLVTLIVIFFSVGAAQDPQPLTRQQQIRHALDRGVQFLISRQTKEKEWEIPGYSMNGGLTALVCLALLESGCKPDQGPLLDGLKYLRTLKPKDTYCRSLRMMIMSHLLLHYPQITSETEKRLLKEDKQQLIQELVRDKDGQMLGWGYPVVPNTFADFSNTHFALMGFHAAQKVGLESDSAFWKNIRELYRSTQSVHGGWDYKPDKRGNLMSMTIAGILGLRTSCHYLQEPIPPRILENALVQAGKLLQPADFFKNTDVKRYPYYTLFTLSEIHDFTQMKELKDSTGKPYQVYDELASLLLKKQSANGAWINRNVIENTLVSTCFALIYLSRLR